MTVPRITGGGFFLAPPSPPDELEAVRLNVISSRSDPETDDAREIPCDVDAPIKILPALDDQAIAVRALGLTTLDL